jgi:hypothetical protein
MYVKDDKRTPRAAYISDDYQRFATMKTIFATVLAACSIMREVCPRPSE